MKRNTLGGPLWACGVALCVLLPVDAAAQIYAGADASTGAVVLSNFRSSDAAMLVEGTTPPIDPAAAASAAPAGARTAPQARAGGRPSAALRSLVDAAAARQNLPSSLVHAVILAESRYDARAVSAKGAIGLMQVMPPTGRRFGASDLYSAEQNVAAGTGYLQSLMARFGGRLDLVLAAYNAGEQAVIRAGCRVPAYPETRAYVKGILERLDRQSEAAWRPGTLTGSGGCA